MPLSCVDVREEEEYEEEEEEQPVTEPNTEDEGEEDANRQVDDRYQGSVLVPPHLNSQSHLKKL